MKAPIKINLEEGKTYFWCSCGLSQNAPFCDGSHKGSDTGKKSQAFVPELSKDYYLCDCKNTKNPPYCDGSHKE